MKIVLWGGTIEGRKITEYLCGTEAEVTVCVATGYGKDLLPEAENIHVRAGRLDAEEMAQLLEELQPDLAVDATHPYAANVSENIRKAAGEKKVPCLRVKRNEAELKETVDGSVAVVSDTEEAVAFLEKTEGTVFLTTGSKELKTFAKLSGFEERVVARVLSSAEVLQMCKDLGLSGRHIIAAQGPFGEELNYAMLKEYGASWMVTKNTGDAGGFQAKWDAAVRAGVKILVIGRPEETSENCVTLQELFTLLKERYSLYGKEEASEAAESSKTAKSSEVQESLELEVPSKVQETSELEENLKAPEPSKTQEPFELEISSKVPAPSEVQEPSKLETASNLQQREEKRTVFLVGIGPGSRELMTGEAIRVVEESDCLIGARRMLEAFPGDKPFCQAYLKEEIAAFIDAHTEYKKFAVLLSGDIGYFSGAKGLSKLLSKRGDLVLRFVPGIASPVYFMDRLGISWDDCLFTSVHGQKINLIDRIRTNRKVCTLIGKKEDVSQICRKLVSIGLPKVRVTVGSRFSYPDESFVSGTAQEFSEREFTSLSVALFENDAPVLKTGGFGVPDGEFIRGKVPMTKEEVRAVSLSKLKLLKDSVVYDVGAGTGSVTMEIADFCCDGMVYAIETNEEALELIRKNAEKFGVDNVRIVPGMAPDCMRELPAPTHVFLGGTKGNLKEIVALVRSKNPAARFVMNVITPESLAQALEFGGEIVQLQISRGRKAGSYHLMTAENPVYIITF